MLVIMFNHGCCSYILDFGIQDHELIFCVYQIKPIRLGSENGINSSMFHEHGVTHAHDGDISCDVGDKFLAFSLPPSPSEIECRLPFRLIYRPINSTAIGANLFPNLSLALHTVPNLLQYIQTQGHEHYPSFACLLWFGTNQKGV